jgi:hypothetical protein
VCKTPPVTSGEFLIISDPLNNYNKFQNFNQDSVAALPSKQRQHAYYNAALGWIMDNPQKFLQLKAMNFLRYLLPGNSWNHYPFKKWLLSFVLAFPIYLFGYYGFFICIKNSFSEHLWFLLYLLAFAFMFTVFIFVNRYRTYLVDVFFLLYAAYAVERLINKYNPAEPFKR